MIYERLSIAQPFQERLHSAQDLFRKFKKNLRDNAEIARFVEELKEATRASGEEMAQTGIVEICRQCEQLEGGSCCGAGIENRYDGPLLLINLLLGAKMPAERYEPKSCFFLGEKGCLLISRHVICVNYLCEKITRRIPLENLRTLREREGNELEILFRFNETLRRVVKSWKPD